MHPERVPFVSMQVWGAAADLQTTVFAPIDRLIAANVRKVQRAFRDNRIGPHHFLGSTGYGHGDWGREALDKVRKDRNRHVTTCIEAAR